MKQRALVFLLMLSGGMLASAAAIPPAHAQLFGESDEEKAARQQHEDNQDAQATQLAGRVRQLEDKVGSLTQSLSTLTGANEDLRHQLDLLNQKLAQQNKDFAYRLCMISAQQLGADSGSGLDCAAAGTVSAGGGGFAQAPGAGGMAPGAALPPVGQSDFGGRPDGMSQSGSFGQSGSTRGPDADASGQPAQLGRPPGILGTLPMGSGPRANAARPAGQGQSTAQYDTAMNLLAKADYDQAKAAFRAYADANPDDDDLAPQAIYWVGDISYVQRNYPDAARAFAEQIKKYPDSSRGPDSMLKLGQSLLAMGQTKEGCTTLGALKSKFPTAPPATLAAASGARTAACH